MKYLLAILMAITIGLLSFGSVNAEFDNYSYGDGESFATGDAEVIPTGDAENIPMSAPANDQGDYNVCTGDGESIAMCADTLSQ